ncbi:Hpt domain-containing protein [Planctomycetota bacterium]
MQESRPTQNKKQAWSHLTQRYVEDLPQQLETIRSCLDYDDFDGIVRHAHRAKGTSATYRLEKIAAQFSALEKAAQARQAQRVLESVIHLAELVAQMRVALSDTEGNAHG